MSSEETTSTPSTDGGSDLGANDVAREGKTMDRQRKRSWFGSFAYYASRILLAVLLIGGATLWYVYQSAQRVPEFYQTVLAQDVQELDDAGDQFETSVLQLQNQRRNSGTWQFEFSQDEINGWLAVDLPEKFPKLLPRQIVDPRVVISEGDLKIAARFNSPRIKGIVVASVDVFATENRNEIGIRIKSVKSGVLPLPVGPYANELTRAMARSKVPITWTELEGDPVCLISLPEDAMVNDDQVTMLRSLNVLDGKILLAGETELQSDSENGDADGVNSAADQASEALRKAIDNR